MHTSQCISTWQKAKVVTQRSFFFEVKATNLHVLWDSKLIDYQELPYVAMTKNYDAADTPADKTVAERRYDGLAI